MLTIARLLAVTLVTVASTWVGSIAAVAQSAGCDSHADYNRCTVGVEVIGSSGGDTPTSSAPSGSDGSSGQPEGPPPGPFDQNCSTQVLSPQPPPGDARWARAGRDPADGPLSMTTCGSPESGMRYLAGFSQPGGAGPAVDPVVVAQQAMDSLTLLPPGIRMAPPSGSAGAVVGLPVWMWVARGESTTGPSSTSASAGGITVTATAELDRVVWEMGDGATVVCSGPGSPFNPARAREGSPDCGHVYQQRSLPERTGGAGVYPITATSVWEVSWEGGGLSGGETVELSSDAQMRVTELQSVNRQGG